MIIATTHKGTDFDGLASVIAATILYPGCVGVVPKMSNRNVDQFLSTHKTAFNLILPGEVKFDSVTKLVVAVPRGDIAELTDLLTELRQLERDCHRRLK